MVTEAYAIVQLTNCIINSTHYTYTLHTIHSYRLRYTHCVLNNTLQPV